MGVVRCIRKGLLTEPCLRRLQTWRRMRKKCRRGICWIEVQVLAETVLDRLQSVVNTGDVSGDASVPSSQSKGWTYGGREKERIGIER